jgi:hypothetical protein
MTNTIYSLKSGPNHGVPVLCYRQEREGYHWTELVPNPESSAWKLLGSTDFKLRPEETFKKR